MKRPCEWAVPWYLHAKRHPGRPSGWWCKAIDRECLTEHPSTCRHNHPADLEKEGSK